MLVSVRLYAGLRERAGRDLVELELPGGATVADALNHLADVHRGSPVVMAVNEAYATPETVLSPGDALALIPPVSGGATPRPPADGPRLPSHRLHARIVCNGPVDAAAVRAAVTDARAGAVVVFEGVTRDVDALEYEAYAAMAERKLHEIVQAAIDRHGLCSAAAEHRTGTVARSEPSVVVAASAPHRDAAFAGARALIDEIKASLPVWKREEGEWVAGALPRPTPPA